MDKSKFIDAAVKWAAKGAYDKAIKEYQRVLEADPKDVRVLQKVGELFQKKNDNAQAAHYFTKVAESYSNDGFFLKAVALYKQVLKLNPALIEVNLKLAELHQQLQLMSDAAAYYQLVANHYESQGETKKSLETLKKMIELEPDNLTSRIKLGELYAREGMSNEAISEFSHILEDLKRYGRQDEYLRVAERLSSLQPADLTLARELASAYLHKGDQKRALAKLQVCFKADPKDVETLKLLADAFSGLGQTAKTLSVYRELARIYADQGNTKDLDRIWAKVSELDPDDPALPQKMRPGATGRPVAPSTPSAASTAPSKAPSPQPAAAPKVGGRSLNKLLTETDVYFKYGLHDKALDNLKKIFEVDPENLEAHEKAYQIYEARQAPQARDSLLNVLRLLARKGDAQRAQPYLDALRVGEPNHPELPGFIRILGIDEAETGVIPGPPSASSASFEAEPAEEDLELREDFSGEFANELGAVEVSGAEVDLALDSASRGSEGGHHINEDELVQDLSDLDEPAPSEPSGRFGPIGEEAPPIGDPIYSATTNSELPAVDVGGEGIPAQYDTDPGLDAYADQPTYEVDESQASADSSAWEEPAPPPGSENLGLITQPSYEREQRAEPPVAVDEALGDAPDTETGANDPVAGELDEAAFFLEQDQLQEAEEILETVLLAYPTHSRATELMQTLRQRQGDSSPSFDDSLSEAFGTEPSSQQGRVGPGAGDEFQYSADEVLQEFKKGVQKAVKADDVDTHYDLAIAYKEMGLLDDALGELATAREAARGKRKELDCLTTMGLIHTMKGDAESAVIRFKEALGLAESSAPDMVNAVRYDLAQAWEASGSPAKALGYYRQVAEADPSFRDAGAKAEALMRDHAPESEEGSSRGRSKARLAR